MLNQKKLRRVFAVSAALVCLTALGCTTPHWFGMQVCDSCDPLPYRDPATVRDHRPSDPVGCYGFSPTCWRVWPDSSGRMAAICGERPCPIVQGELPGLIGPPQVPGEIVPSAAPPAAPVRGKPGNPPPKSISPEPPVKVSQAPGQKTASDDLPSPGQEAHPLSATQREHPSR